MKTWDGTSLEGLWALSTKLDGVRMLRDEDGNPVSRAGKPLYNLEHIDKAIVDAEIYCGSWERTITAVRTKDGAPVDPFNVYSLNPLDKRLFIGEFVDLHFSEVWGFLDTIVNMGYEGLVAQQGDKIVKIKKVETYDEVVTEILTGKGRLKKKMGAVMTSKGKVGTGFTDEERDGRIQIGTVIEVESMGLTPGGKFRHPRFKRIRWDK